MRPLGECVILEITIIEAHDLALASKRIRQINDSDRRLVAILTLSSPRNYNFFAKFL